MRIWNVSFIFPTRVTVQTESHLQQGYLWKIVEEISHRDSKGVAVGNFIVYNGLNVDSLQLEINCYIDQPADRSMKKTNK